MRKTGEGMNVLLAKMQVRLNLIIILNQAAQYLFWVGLAVGLAMVALRWLGLITGRIELWFGLVLAGGFGGAIIGWRRRLNLMATAGWLDEHLHNGEAFSAALFCKQRDWSGEFDQAILESVRKQTVSIAQVRWPYRAVVRQVLLAAGVNMLIPLLFFVINYGGFRGMHSDFGSLLKQSELVKARSNPKSNRYLMQTAQTIAQQLFPDDTNLANQAELALNNGDLILLEQLLNQSALNAQRKMNGLTDPVERRQLQAKEAEREQLASDLKKQLADQSGPKQDSQNRLNRDEEEDNWDQNQSGLGGEQNRLTENTASSGKNKSGKNATGKDRSSQGDDLTKSEAESETGENGSGAGGGSGTTAGSGKGRQQGNWGKVTARSGSPQILLNQGKEGPVFEYVLPGQNARVPLSQVLPFSQRSAEAALNRQGVPGEYTDFIQAYFLMLAQETKGGSPESGAQK